ncbi:D-amino acid aminotransferase [Sansalvadorimonas verongulae]|uniref:D-amino acid aminotransferase n=1 Tax=Sansalvadorimonas verongulae TaxID=2172824 RepID=UPI0012BB8276|nr:D-amino acid aminotransferase [Sansalvadorimonas verongulae]MTI14716.1 D-amino acid aminotransferase [Sansalvadorimonas verongulae]
MSQVYLNGEFIPVEEAQISVLDRGFLFGDGVYEVIPLFNGKPLQQEEHIARLYRSLDAIDLSIDQKPEEWSKLFQTLFFLNKDDGDNQSIYLQITRGTGKVRSHNYPDGVKPTVFAMTMPFIPGIQANQPHAGGKAITVADQRWQRCDIKSISLLGNLIPHHSAVQAGVTEAIQIDDQGRVTEGASSNVFVICDGRIITPPLSDRILGGVTRALILQLAANDSRYICEERELSANDLQQADEIWITSSSREIVPIIELDGVSVGSGKPGPVWEYMAGLYRSYRDGTS